MKRAFDFSASLLALVILSPVLILLAVAILLTMGWPVLFRQTRPGYLGRPFTLVKFRTLNSATDGNDMLLPDAERITRIGSFMRRSSLDELPQLWNVLTGAMSLVGPRPLLVEYLDRYTPEQARRHEVRPGITGWAQIHGRQDIPFSRRLEYDVWYVDNRNLRLDVRILVATLARVLHGSGVRLDQDVREVDDLRAPKKLQDSGTDHD